MHRTILALPLIVLASLLGACAHSADISEPPALPLSESELRRLPIYDGHTGARVTWDEAIARLGRADAILIGEVHSHPVGLPAASLMFADLLEAAPGSHGALALEFIERQHQPALDRYRAGSIDRAGFRAEAHRTVANYPPAHESMLERAKDAGWELIAANAPRRLVRLARTDGFEALEEALAGDDAGLAAMPGAHDDRAYRDRFMALMTGMHSAPAEPAPIDEPSPVLMSFFRAQQVWDATMADSVASARDEGHRPVVLVVGRFHTDHQGATLTRVRERRPEDALLTITCANRSLGLIGLRDEDRAIADLVIYTGE